MKKPEKNNDYKVITEKRTRSSVYKIIMLVILVAFVTFIITTIGFYQYFTNSDNGKKFMITTSSKLPKIV